ncbi:MAG: GxxExxY protein [Caldilineaceae bacterium]
MFGACIDVQRQLGPHCMEVDYQRALALALPKHGLEFVREAEIPILFDGVEVTRRRVDFVIWDQEATVILETKAAEGVE